MLSSLNKVIIIIIIIINNVVVVCRLHYINTLKQELHGTRAYQETHSDERSVVNAHLNELPVKFSVCVNEGQVKLHTIY